MVVVKYIAGLNKFLDAESEDLELGERPSIKDLLCMIYDRHQSSIGSSHSRDDWYAGKNLVISVKKALKPEIFPVVMFGLDHILYEGSHDIEGIVIFPWSAGG